MTEIRLTTDAYGDFGYGRDTILEVPSNAFDNDGDIVIQHSGLNASVFGGYLFKSEFSHIFPDPEPETKPDGSYKLTLYISDLKELSRVTNSLNDRLLETAVLVQN